MKKVLYFSVVVLLLAMSSCDEELTESLVPKQKLTNNLYTNEACEIIDLERVCDPSSASVQVELGTSKLDDKYYFDFISTNLDLEDDISYIYYRVAFQTPDIKNLGDLSELFVESPGSDWCVIKHNHCGDDEIVSVEIASVNPPKGESTHLIFELDASGISVPTRVQIQGEAHPLLHNGVIADKLDFKDAKLDRDPNTLSISFTQDIENVSEIIISDD